MVAWLDSYKFKSPTKPKLIAIFGLLSIFHFVLCFVLFCFPLFYAICCFHNKKNKSQNTAHKHIAISHKKKNDKMAKKTEKKKTQPIFNC